MPIQTLRPEPDPATHTTETLTVEAAIRLVNGWTDLTPICRRGLASALATVAQMAGLPAGSLLLTPVSLRQHMLNRPAAAWGGKTASKSNIRSRLRFILRRLDLIEPAETPVTDAWRILLHRLESLHRSGIVGFSRFCSARGIAPAAVRSATLAAFQEHLETRTLTPNPRKRIGDLRGSWNSACGTVDGWPTDKIPALIDADRYILPPEAFPESFLQDLAALGRQLGGSILGAHHKTGANAIGVR